MKDFIKNVFANIVAILLIGAVLLGIMIMIFVVSAMSGDQKPFVENNSVLTINFKGNILDSYTEKEESIFDFGQNKDVLLLDVVNAINNAKKDEKIKGISIEVDNLPAGITQVDDIRASIEDFKKSGKFIIQTSIY
jgi:protease-4